MENAADALKMAGSVLLFVIALSVAILAFTQARESADILLSYSDRESLTIEGDSRFYYIGDSEKTNRHVGKETIIPAIYRAYKENYKIIFIFNDGYYLFTKKDSAGSMQEINKIDLAEQSIGSDTESRQFLNGILYRDFGSLTESQFNQKFNINVNSKSLYDYLGTKTFKESLGTYYIEDLKTYTENNPTTDGTNTSELSDVNKTEKRVITYAAQ